MTIPSAEVFEAMLQMSNKLVRDSHISFETSLYYHDCHCFNNPILHEILAIGQNKVLEKHLGIFRYIKNKNCSYPDGVKTISANHRNAIIIASKEKALADILVRRSTPKFDSENDLEKYIVEEIGIRKEFLENLDDNELMNIRISYNKLNVRFLSRLYSKTDGGRIWVADFPANTTSQDLSLLFQPFGEMSSLTIRNKSNMYMAFVNMKNPLDGKQAIRNLDGQLFMGKRITVKESNQKIERTNYVYALLDFDKKECYIGETCDPTRRFKQHLSGKGDASSYPWIVTLKKKPQPVILEQIPADYGSDYKAHFLETVWRYVADENGWQVVNYPYIPKKTKELQNAIEQKIISWPRLISEGGH